MKKLSLHYQRANPEYAPFETAVIRHGGRIQRISGLKPSKRKRRMKLIEQLSCRNAPGNRVLTLLRIGNIFSPYDEEGRFCVKESGLTAHQFAAGQAFSPTLPCKS
jgi:hypothetical protein